MITNEINVWTVISIMGLHWMFDFVWQTDKQAKGKSKNWKDLLSHTLSYSFGFGFLITAYILISKDFNNNLIWFAPITFICHTVTDYFTSRLNSKLWAKGDSHYFFVSIGFDQWLHLVQLLLTWQILNQK